MVLKKLVAEPKNKEKYSTKDSFGRKCQSVPEGFLDVEDAVRSKLKDYCEFEKAPSTRGHSGGRVQNRYWVGEIETEDGRSIEVGITQSYGQPGPYLTGATATIEYDPRVTEEDLNIVRDALTSSGLEKIEA